MLLVQLLLLLPQVEELRTTLMCQPEAFIEVCVCVCVRRVPAGETTIAGIAPAFLPLSGRERERVQPQVDFDPRTSFVNHTLVCCDDGRLVTILTYYTNTTSIAEKERERNTNQKWQNPTAACIHA